MYLDYSKLEFDAFGRPETPELELRTLSGEVIGILSGVSNLKMNIKFAEPSEITFDLPRQNDGIPTPFYDDVTGYKLIHTKNYGVYVIMNPDSEDDGISDVKQVKGYSIEKTLDTKKFFLEEGTYNFWNPASPEDTLVGRILEIVPGWSAGYVSPSLIGRYRTFDGYDDYLLSFIYDKAPEKFRCVFVFDPYKKTINAYDADEEKQTMPIYLDFDNLIQTVKVQEDTDGLVTALRPYGADGLDIRDVNPIGTNWIYDISYFIANGDVPDELAKKWEVWRRSVLNNQAYYKGLVALRSSATARMLAEQAKLTDLNGELADLTNQQSVLVQAIALETTDEGRRTQQAKLDEVNRRIAAKNAEINAEQGIINGINEDINGDGPSSYNGQIRAVVDSLAVDKYFTTDEYETLSHYFIENDMTDNTFVATDVDADTSGSSYDINNGTFTVDGSAIVEIDLTQNFGKKMYTLAGGTFALSGEMNISGDIIRGTLEKNEDDSYVMSVHAGTITAGETTSPSGMITIYGHMSGFENDIHSVTVQEVTTQEGTRFSFSLASSTMFLTVNVSDYQKYSVQMELYDYAANVLGDAAVPTYEFSVDSANFIFAQEFEPFRKSLELGKAVYLRLTENEVITPIIIEVELDFENRERFSLVFSNRFKRHDHVNTLRDMIESSYSSGRSFDASKHIYNQTVGQASQVSKFMAGSIDAAKNTILGASGQTVKIDGAGLHIGGDSKYQIRAVDRMIAMTDDGWQTAKLAIGLFASPEVGEYWGVNADVIGGKLLIGNNLILENKNDTGVMQFRVDSSGAWLNNATFVLQSDDPAVASIARSGEQRIANTGGKIILDPRYGIVGGGGTLFTTEGTTVTPSFIDEDGRIVTDEFGFPTNANFFLDMRDGNAYFRGTVYANDGVFNGTVYATDGEFTGKITATSGTFKGRVEADSGYFKGDIMGSSGTFGGTLKAARYEDANGNNMMNSSGQFTSDYLDVRGLNVNNRFKVDENGNVTITGGSISFSSLDSATQSTINSKTTTYYYQPSSYNAGDLYFHDGKTYRAQVSRGWYYEYDWVEVTSSGLTAEEVGTVITDTLVSAPTIEGAKIYGGVYWDSDKRSYMEVATQSGWGSFALYRKIGSDTRGTNYFSIREYDGGAISLEIFDDTVFSHYQYGNSYNTSRTTYPYNIWDFSRATVTGLTAVFA